MSHIYIAFVNTPGIFANILHHVLKQKYIHVVLSFDEKLEEAYSFGRRNPFIPILAGFEREEKQKIVRAFPTAEYQICEIECTRQQKEWLLQQVHKDYENRFHYHYAVCSLPFVWKQIPFPYQKNCFTCSSYLAKLFEEAGCIYFQKHFSIVTPKDFYELQDKTVIFEGKLADLLKEQRKSAHFAAEGILYEG